jgi:murein DD-endopeptidase MepM/ murein hydrolase activator NlpD
VKSSYLIKIVPPWGYRVWRLEFSPRHIACAAALSFVTLSGVGGYYLYTMHHAEARVRELRSLTDSQHERLRRIDLEASQLDGDLRALEKQNEQIRKMIGADGKSRSTPGSTTATRDGRQSLLERTDDFKVVAARIERLRAQSSRLQTEGDSLRTLALHVLNMRRLEDLARARMLAAIPSLNPVGGSIASGFGWRFSPWPEFHKGLDLTADYGDSVRAAAAGTVVSAGWDGGYGVKIDIDHGNGYHTWYAHLSDVNVSPGQYVRKAQVIARVGSTGASTGPHLHYQVMLDGSAINPTPYLNGVPEKVLASLGKP